MPLNDAVVFHSRQAAAWEAGYLTPKFSVRFEVLKSLLEDRDIVGQSWLDAGCGTGSLARWLAANKGCNVTGVDASGEMITNCYRTSGTKFQVIDDITDLPFTDGAFDGVLCSSVLEYTRSPEDALAELHRVIRKGGVLAVSVPSSHPLARWPALAIYWLTKPLGRWKQLTFLDYSRYAYSPSQFSGILRKSSFAPERLRKFGVLRFRKIRVTGAATMLMFLARAL
jgi:ubiquinone/menaquinone biosynthesis C-methylase UbiE